MIWLTIPQAAARVGRKVDTIRRWVAVGDLTAIRNPIDRQRYVREEQLLDVERARRAAARANRAIGQEAS
ncbi:helix-turn-helix domain-containing protein [Kineosporia sp. R_H_3]|uniref:helix-turn-helix domain-containing protein n=1 Tax=Kineosporia sp. R_H_3 TaxID=1961848 RepID=UPI000B4B5A2F|nr:helix-turn-helix domain-containing protein [Kineosporia sp. R_H_3]